MSWLGAVRDLLGAASQDLLRSEYPSLSHASPAAEDVGMMRAGNETRKGDWMETSTGARFYPLDPRHEEVCIQDIAHHLSRIGRYNGATRVEHCSVAEHSVLMARWLLKTTRDPLIAYQGLFHDAPEAYIGDMVRPLKRNMPAFVAAEELVWAAIVDAFPMLRPQGKRQADDAECSSAWYELHPLVKEADNRILVDERAQVMYPFGNTWGIDHLEPLGVSYGDWSPNIAKAMFRQEEAFLAGIIRLEA